MKPNKKHKWFIKKISSYEWFAESQSLGQATIVSAHCGACARAELISKHGGWVDTRGMHVYGYCSNFLNAINQASKFGN